MGRQGFFYNRLPMPADASLLVGAEGSFGGRQLWYHRVGTPQAADAFVLALPEQPDASIASQITSDKQCAARASAGGLATAVLRRTPRARTTRPVEAPWPLVTCCRRPQRAWPVPRAGRCKARRALARVLEPVTRAPRATGRYLVLSISLGGGAFNRLWYLPLAAVPVNASTGALDFGRYDMRLPAGQRVALPLTKLVDDLNAAWTLVAVNGTLWTLHTSLAAPRFRCAPP